MKKQTLLILTTGILFFAYCKKDDPEKCGYIDSTMKEVVTLKYKPNYLSGFHNGIAKLSTNNGCFFIDTMGNPISLLTQVTRKVLPEVSFLGMLLPPLPEWQ